MASSSVEPTTLGDTVSARVAVPRGRGVVVGRMLVGALIGVALLIGLLLRIWALGREPVSSDEAIVALMAREILHGHTFAFYWGQRYGGGEPYVVAAVFALFGQSSFTLGLSPVLLDLAAALLVWRIGRRLFTPAVGIAAALLFWLWPEVFVWQSTIEYGFRLLALDCGLLLTLVTIRLSGTGSSGTGSSGTGSSGTRSRRNGPRATRPGGFGSESSRSRLALSAIAGSSLGVGWWCSPEIAYYALPAFGVLGWRLVRRRARISVSEAVVALISAGIGALPWLWSNVPDGFASLRTGSGSGSSGGYVSHLRVFFEYVLPIVLGVRLPVSGGWLLVPGSSSPAITGIAIALYVAALAVGVAWLVRLALTRRSLVLVGFVALFPFLYATFPTAWFWRDGRYAVYLAPVVALLATSVLDAAARRLRTARSAGRGPAAVAGRLRVAVPLAGVVLAALALTLVAVTQQLPYRPEVSPGRATWQSWRSDPNVAIVNLARGLESAGIRDVYAGYWVAYILDLEGRGRVLASDSGRFYVRYEPYLTSIEHSHDPSWVFENPALRGQAEVGIGTSVLDPGCATKGQTCLLAPELESWLRRHGVAYRAMDIGDFVVVRPRTNVPPATVLRAFAIVG